jgi:hypothetical protein
MLENMQAKAAAKRKKASGDIGETDGHGEKRKDKTAAPERKRLFKQIPLAKRQPTEDKDRQPEQVQRVLSKIF